MERVPFDMVPGTQTSLSPQREEGLRVRGEKGLKRANRKNPSRQVCCALVGLTPPHEPKGRAGCPHPAAGHAGHFGRPRRGEDTQPYPPLAVQGFKARTLVGRILSPLHPSCGLSRNSTGNAENPNELIWTSF